MGLGKKKNNLLMDKGVMGFCLEESQDAFRIQMALGLAEYN